MSKRLHLTRARSDAGVRWNSGRRGPGVLAAWHTQNLGKPRSASSRVPRADPRILMGPPAWAAASRSLCGCSPSFPTLSSKVRMGRKKPRTRSGERADCAPTCSNLSRGIVSTPRRRLTEKCGTDEKPDRGGLLSGLTNHFMTRQSCWFAHPIITTSQVKSNRKTIIFKESSRPFGPITSLLFRSERPKVNSAHLPSLAWSTELAAHGSR